MFENWSKGIETVGKGLAASLTWSSRVQYFIAEFKKEKENVAFILNSNGVEL